MQPLKPGGERLQPHSPPPYPDPPPQTQTHKGHPVHMLERKSTESTYIVTSLERVFVGTYGVHPEKFDSKGWQPPPPDPATPYFHACIVSHTQLIPTYPVDGLQQVWRWKARMVCSLSNLDLNVCPTPDRPIPTPPHMPTGKSQSQRTLFMSWKRSCRWHARMVCSPSSQVGVSKHPAPFPHSPPLLPLPLPPIITQRTLFMS